MVGNNKRCFEVNLLKRTFRDVMLEKKKDEEQGYLAVRSLFKDQKEENQYGKFSIRKLGLFFLLGHKSFSFFFVVILLTS